MKFKEKIRYKLLQQTYGRRLPKKTKGDSAVGDMEEYLESIFGGNKKSSRSEKDDDSDKEV